MLLVRICHALHLEASCHLAAPPLSLVSVPEMACLSRPQATVPQKGLGRGLQDHQRLQQVVETYGGVPMMETSCAQLLPVSRTRCNSFEVIGGGDLP